MPTPPPKRIAILLEAEVSMDSWDSDVDWSNPQKVILEQINCVGLFPFVQEGVDSVTIKKINIEPWKNTDDL